MDEEKRPLSEEEAIAFAGVSESTLHRYISAGFINPVVEGEQRFFDEDELIQVFELSPKKAAASRKALKKKPLSPAEKLISEKDRLVADKDIQIRDLKDQRSWLQSRVERLEAELLALKNEQSSPVAPAVPGEPITGVPLPQSIERGSATNEGSGESAPSAPLGSTQEIQLEATQRDSEGLSSDYGSERVTETLTPAATTTALDLESKTSAKAQQAGSSFKKVLRYLGFIKPEPALQQPAITSRASEIIALDRTGERVATVPPSDETSSDEQDELTEPNKPEIEDQPASNNVIEVTFTAPASIPDFGATATPQPGAVQSSAPATAPGQPLRGNRPFRESKQTLAELLGDNRPLDPSFAANEESE
jgi:hypothetical protein